MAQKEDRRIGSIIGGKWRVDHLLGTGSMASVYAVTHRNGVKAALKILHPQLCTDPSVCERFLGEGHLTNSVKHRGIVRVLDDGMTDDGCVFLVMDLLEGTTLEDLRQARGGKLSLDETLDIADQLTDALSAVHKAGIIHRDLKPQNVFICTDGEVKLLDFGVARLLETSKNANKLSLFGMVLGTPSFMSPEQATGARDQIDQRTDVYALGATLFTSLTGETVHLGPHVQAKLLAAGTTQARSISVVNPELPPAIAAIIDTSLRFEKADRWQSVDAFQRALREARNALAPQSLSPASLAPKSVAPKSSAKKTQRHSGGPKSLAPKSDSISPTKRRSQYPKANIPSSSAPPAPLDNGRTRTLMGVGGLDASAFPPPAKKTLSYGMDTADLAPASTDMPSYTPKSQSEESYPAVHTPIPLNDTGYLMSQITGKKKGSGLFWLASVGLLALSIGAVAFFASTGTGSPSANAASSIGQPIVEDGIDAGTTTTTSAVQPTGTGIVIGDQDVPAASDASTPKPHAAITPPSTWRPQHHTPPASVYQPSNNNFPRAQANPEPPAANQAAPAAAPATAADPFATPE